MSYGRKWIEHPEWNIELVGGWDHDTARRDSSVASLGIKAYDTPDALLADVDAVVISSETSFHAELTELAAAVGRTSFATSRWR
ncbi:MAG: Gfo/Idh/MocA family oxidoreductase [Clostridia bacterium]|nr:Gfo/Idh/MocA family oxidoreductase [Clostridia bacterium]